MTFCDVSICVVAFSVVFGTFFCIRDRELCMLSAFWQPTLTAVCHRHSLMPAASCDVSFSAMAEWSAPLSLLCSLPGAFCIQRCWQMIWSICRTSFSPRPHCECVRGRAMQSNGQNLAYSSDRCTVLGLMCRSIRWWSIVEVSQQQCHAVCSCVWPICSTC